MWGETQALAEASDAQLLERFTTRGEEAAFTALLRRHGPMVLSVSQRVLHRLHDAEDVFQATFLLLARKADSICKREAVGSWLHGVAHRLAVKAKAQGICRQNHERRAADMRDTRNVAEVVDTSAIAWRDVQNMLDAALAELPEKYRAALVLCCLEGSTLQEAAQLLDCPPATVGTWVARGRALLRKRLTTRGLTLSTAGLAALLLATAAPAAAPSALVKATLKAALPFAMGQAAAALCSARVAGLVEGGLQTMFLTKTKVITAVVVLCFVAGATALAHQRLAASESDTSAAASTQEQGENGRPKAPAAKPPIAKDTNDDKESVTYRGRVLEPAGKPVQNAKVYLLNSPDLLRASLKLRATTGEDGKYHFTVPKAQFDTRYAHERLKDLPVVALAEGYGLGLPREGSKLPDGDVVIQLVKDDLPVSGRIIDLQGKPIAGVKVRVRGIQVPKKGDLTSFIAALKNRKEGFSVQAELLNGFHDPYHGWDLDSIYPPAITDARGRFTIKGIGRERVADLRIEGPSIETKAVYVMTRKCETITVPYVKGQEYPVPSPYPQYTHSGVGFDHVAAPCKPVIGVVRDKDTGKPIPGAVIRSYRLAGNLFDERVNFRVVADKDGRYKITGLPHAKGNEFQVKPPAGQPYLMITKDVGTTPGLEPITVDVELKRGVWIDVKVTDKVTGKPVRCSYDYFVYQDNPHLKEVPGFSTGSQLERIASDGKFRLVGLPGRSLIGVRASAIWAGENNYLTGIGADRIKGRKGNAPLRTMPFWCIPEEFHAIAEINPAKDAESVTCNLELDPGRTLTGTFVGPDGKPLAGAFTWGMGGTPSWNYQPLKTAEFKLTAIKPGQPRRLMVLHKDKRLAGTLLLRGDEKGPLTIKLQPWGVVTGKLINQEGKPVTDYQIMTLDGDIITPDGVQARPLDAGSLLQPVKPDKDGHFRIEGLVPGLKYNLRLAKGNYIARITGPVGGKDLTVKVGETKDLGEIKAGRIDE
jgi:RNA polymerase sigma factor (sigma-70 family)